MNIENISALADQLEALGLEKAGSALSKRICFKPESFHLSFTIKKDKDNLSFLVHFEKDKDEDRYNLLFHDAILKKEIIIPDKSIEGVNIRVFEKLMASINWKKVFDLDEQNPWNAGDPASWIQEEKVEKIIETIPVLLATEESKKIASSLKEKYWSDVPFSEFISFITPLKGKSEVSQRFYFFDGQPGISVDEAYRFLQNKWMEKQMQNNRKHVESDSTEDNNGTFSSEQNLSKRMKQRKNKMKK